MRRFTDPTYADLTIRMRAGHNPADLFDQLDALGLVQLHDSDEAAHEAIPEASSTRGDRAVTVSTNDEARTLNERIRAQRAAAGEVNDPVTVAGRDGVSIGRGDTISTRKNESTLRIANRC